VDRLGIVIVGGGLAGLMAAVRAAEENFRVDLLSLMPVRRSHSVCAQGGINAAVNTKGEGDSPWQHFDDTIYGGDFLANQTPVKRMCEAAPGIIHLFDRMGVMFNRTPEGLLDFRRFGGTRHQRTAHAGTTTGQQLLYALDEQVRRYEAAEAALDTDEDGTSDLFLPRETLDDRGAYSQVLWGFRRNWVAGLRGDYVTGDEGAFDSFDTDPARRTRWRVSPNLTWFPTEYSKFRLQWNHDRQQEDRSDDSLWLQFEFLLGAHAAHKF
jgi:succinate dehydrogenase/fumarate reductase flavoprotein subunit